MIKVEASPDGLTWHLYAMKNSIQEARDAAANCIRMTNHTQVRIVEA